MALPALLKSKLFLGGSIAVFLSIGIYWWSLTSTISNLQAELSTINDRNVQLQQLYHIERAAVMELVGVIESENRRVQQLRDEVVSANARAAESVRDIIERSNTTNHAGTETAEEMNEWLLDLFQ